MGSSYTAFRNQAQKDFVKKFDSVCYSKSRWEVWTDMIYMFAASISNSVDRRFYEKREKEYMRTISKYKRE